MKTERPVAKASVLTLALASIAALLSTACGPSLASMHARARTGEVQPDAPLHTTKVVVVHAPRAAVWAVLTDFARWPAWQPTVSAVTPPEALVVDASFRWVNGTSTIDSKLALVEPYERLAWTGSVATAKAIHQWRFDELSPETTRVTVDESMDGFVLTWFYGQAQLDADVARSLDDLKRAAEGHAQL